jgi:AbrB family looped-hinge helix DNA binding protein
MPTKLTVTAKGQVTLRKEVLEHLGIAPGDKVEVDLLPAGRAQMRAAKPAGSIAAFLGCLRRPGRRRLSTKRIGELASQGWAGRR